MIQFMILLAISPILIPAFAIVCAALGAVAGLWFGAFLVIGMFDLFLAGWKE